MLFKRMCLENKSCKSKNIFELLG